MEDDEINNVLFDMYVDVTITGYDEMQFDILFFILYLTVSYDLCVAKFN